MATATVTVAAPTTTTTTSLTEPLGEVVAPTVCSDYYYYSPSSSSSYSSCPSITPSFSSSSSTQPKPIIMFDHQPQHQSTAVVPLSPSSSITSTTIPYTTEVLSTYSSSHYSRRFVMELENGKLEFDVPENLWNLNDSCCISNSIGEEEEEQYLLDWIWKNCQEKIRQSLRLKRSDTTNKSQLQKAQERLRLLDKITQVQRQYLVQEQPKVVFGGLLDCLLECTGSEYGFIGEVKYEETMNGKTGEMYLQTHAISNIAWDATTREFYDSNIEFGLKFTNLNSLFGYVMTTGECVIANNPSEHPSSVGIPPGHPPLTHFLGIPFFLPGGKILNGMVGIANKPGGYTQEDITYLEPLTITCSNLIQAYRTNKENEYLINKLEDLVIQRTSELEQANATVVDVAKRQMEHFACMSHEIRTPLNCVVGISSLLIETDLTPFQRDSIQMIIQSGDLLMAVVNDVLDYSKLQTDHMTMDITTCNLQDTLDAVVHSIESKALSKNVKVLTYYDCTVPEIVQTDSRRVQQILYNLLGNAIKFSNDGGIVELSIYVVAADPDSDYDDSDENKADQNEDEIDNNNVDHENPGKLNCGNSTSSIFPRAVESINAETKVINNNLHKNAHENSTEKSETQYTRHDDSGAGGGCPFISMKDQTNKAEITACPYPRDVARRSISSTASADRQSIMNELEEVLQQQHPDGHPDGNTSSRSLPLPDSKSRLRFVVKDYGKGIAKEDFDTIFQPFQQAKRGNTVHEGTGLGLSITSRLVKGLGGVIRVDSELGQWSEFSLEIPLLGEPVPVDTILTQLQNTTVLFIDQDATKGSSLTATFCKSHEIPTIESTSCDCLDSLANDCRTGTYNYQSMITTCLIHEDTFVESSYRNLVSAIGGRIILITYGKKYSIAVAHRHFRSLYRTLPSVILQAMISVKDALLQQIHEKQLQSTLVKSTTGLSSQSSSSTDGLLLPKPIDYAQVTALIAEDNVINQKILVGMLKRVGLSNIDVVDNGQSAYEHSAQKQYDIIFMDMQMPIMGGIEATELIVKHYSSIPDGTPIDKSHNEQEQQKEQSSSLSSNKIKKPCIIFVTAHATHDYKQLALAAGGNGFLSKPFNLKAIQQLLQTMVVPPS